jgi:MATE family multidrug resistance protein
MVDISRVGIVGAGIGTIASRFVMLGYMHYMMQKRKSFSLFREVFSKNIKRSVNITIIRLERLLPCKCFFEVGLFTGAVWLFGCLRNNQSGSKSNSIKFGHLYVYVRYGFKCSRYHSSW